MAEPLPVAGTPSAGTLATVGGVAPARLPGAGGVPGPLRYAFGFQLMRDDGTPYGEPIALVLDRANVDYMQEQLRRARELAHTVQEQN